MSEEFKPDNLEPIQPDASSVIDTQKTDSPQDIFRKDPTVEHVISKRKDNKPRYVDVTAHSDSSFVQTDYIKKNETYSNEDKPLTSIHNHPRDSSELGPEIDAISHTFTLPSPADLESFMWADEDKTKAIYQHNPKTNETEGIFVIRKTEKTPKSGINFSKFATKLKKGDDIINKIAQVDGGKIYDVFERGINEKLRDYFELVTNKQHSKIPIEERPKERQRLLDKIAEELHLQIRYVPVDGFYYSPGIGFLKKVK